MSVHPKEQTAEPSVIGFELPSKHSQQHQNDISKEDTRFEKDACPPNTHKEYQTVPYNKVKTDLPDSPSALSAEDVYDDVDIFKQGMQSSNSETMLMYHEVENWAVKKREGYQEVTAVKNTLGRGGKMMIVGRAKQHDVRENHGPQPTESTQVHSPTVLPKPKTRARVHTTAHSNNSLSQQNPGQGTVTSLISNMKLSPPGSPSQRVPENKQRKLFVDLLQDKQQTSPPSSPTLTKLDTIRNSRQRAATSVFHQVKWSSPPESPANIRHHVAINNRQREATTFLNDNKTSPPTSPAQTELSASSKRVHNRVREGRQPSLTDSPRQQTNASTRNIKVKRSQSEKWNSQTSLNSNSDQTQPYVNLDIISASKAYVNFEIIAGAISSQSQKDQKSSPDASPPLSHQPPISPGHCHKKVQPPVAPKPKKKNKC